MKLFAFSPATEKPLTIFEVGVLVEWILISNKGYASLRRGMVYNIKYLHVCLLGLIVFLALRQ